MPAYRMRNAIALSALIVAAVICATPPVFAQRAATADSKPAAQAGKADATSNPSGQQGATDTKPASQLREVSRAEAEVLIEGMKPYLNTSIAGLKPVHHDDGTVSIDLEGRFQSVSIAKIGADGTIIQGCVSSEEEARQFLLPGTKKSAKKPATPTSAPATSPAKPVLEEK